MLASACGGASSGATSTHSASGGGVARRGTGAHPAARHGPAQGSRDELPGGLTSIPAPAPTGLPASTADMRVIISWANALRNGNVAEAAALFKLPSAMINGLAANGGLSVMEFDGP